MLPEVPNGAIANYCILMLCELFILASDPLERPRLMELCAMSM